MSTTTIATVAALQSAINAAHAGDVLTLAQGITLDLVATQLAWKSGVRLQGNGSQTIKGTPPTPDTQGNPNSAAYLIKLPSGSTDVVFDGVNFLSSNGIFWVGSGSTRFTLTNNGMQWGAVGNYYNRLAYFMEAGAGHKQPRVENNYLHGSTLADRVTEAWDCTDYKFRWNRVDACHDLGHFMDHTGNFEVSYNYITNMQRMCLGEMQNACTGAAAKWINNVVDGVIDWNNSTFGVSAMGWDATTVEIAGNYIRFNSTTGHGTMDADINPPRLGTTVEASGRWVAVHDNVVGGNVLMYQLVTASGHGVLAWNNKLYGTMTEPALLGTEVNHDGTSGSITDLGFNQQLPAAQMPAPTAYLAAIQPAIGPNWMNIVAPIANPITSVDTVMHYKDGSSKTQTSKP